MVLPDNIRDREYKKFGLTRDDEVAVRTLLEQGIRTSSGNSSTDPLGATGEFIGDWELVSQFPEITLNCAGAPSIAPGTFFFEFSPDGVNPDVSVPISIVGPNSLVPQPLRTVLPYFRVRYVNGATPLTELRITTIYHWTGAKMLTRFLNQTILEDEPVENVRAIVAGQSPDGPFSNLRAGGQASEQSTLIPLGSGGVFNGSGPMTDVSGYVAVTVTIISDVPSAVDGVQFQWFQDAAGTISLGSSDFSYNAQPDQAHFQVPAQGPYFRMVYTNNSTAQTNFALQTTLLTGPPPSDVLSIGDVINAATLAQIVKANIVGLREDGSYDNVGLSDNSAVKVAIADRPSEIRGRNSFLIPIDNISLVAAPGTTVHTVTAGHTFYLQSFFISQLNDSASNGNWRMTDNGINKSSFILPSRSGGTPASSASASPNLPEPIPFTTNVRLEEVTGSVQVSGFLLGYEEPN